tara:strand:- start:463 stop:1008 length:546 start_codon:yes stop_codon:yes gene_type:complete
MEEFNTSKNHRTVRLERNKSGLYEGKWLRRRFARNNEMCVRMAESLHESDHTQAAFFKTFCPDDLMKHMVELGENPYRNPKMRPQMHKKKINKFKARARDRKSKMAARELTLNEESQEEVVIGNLLPPPAHTIQAWDNHIALLKREWEERILMEAAVNALMTQRFQLALERGTRRKWSSVV